MAENIERLKKRVAELESELTQARQALLQAQAQARASVDPRESARREARINLERAEKVYARLKDAMTFQVGREPAVSRAKLEDAEHWVSQARKRLAELG